MKQVQLSAFADEIDMNLTIQMDELEKHNIRYIEMRGVNDVNISNVTIEQAKEIKSQLDARGFKISSLGSPIGKIYLKDNFDEHKEMFARLLEVASILGAKYMRIFSFFMEEHTNYDDYAEEVISKLTELAEMADSYNITLLHENEKDIYGDTPARCLNLVTSINKDNFRLVFDPANFVQVNEDTLKAHDLLKEYVAYYHIKDARLDDKKVVPAGHGDGNIPEIIERITSNGYNGFLSLEPHLGNFAGFADLENLEEGSVETLEKSDASKFALATESLKDILDRKNISYI